jgi:hypothetical protein
MDFTDRKLPKSAAGELKRVTFESISPYVPVFAPVYVFMKRNEKFLGIKSPLDFFTPSDLEKLKAYDCVYVPRKVFDQVSAFQDAGRRVKTLLFEKPLEVAKGKQDSAYPEVKLPPSGFEVSDTVIRVLGPIWGKKLRIEPFFLAAFVEDLCSPLPENSVLPARERDIEAYESGVLRAALAVFIAIHLGFCSKSFLDELRTKVFRRFALSEVQNYSAFDLSEIEEITALLIRSSVEREIDGNAVRALDGIVAARFASRLDRVRDQLIKSSPFQGSIYGPEGFLNAG